jgi:hypothetical protein
MMDSPIEMAKRCDPDCAQLAHEGVATMTFPGAPLHETPGLPIQCGMNKGRLPFFFLRCIDHANWMRDSDFVADARPSFTSG